LLVAAVWGANSGAENKVLGQFALLDLSI